MAFDIGSAFGKLSPEAQAAVISGGLNLGGGLISGMGQGKAADERNAFDLASLIAQMQQRQSEMKMNDQQFLDTLAFQRSQADPLTQEKSRAGFAAQRDIMTNARPVDLQFDSNTGMGKLSGGFGIPQGGFSADTLSRYEQPSAEALAAQVTPQRPAMGSDGNPVATLQQLQGPQRPATIPDGYEWDAGKGQLKKKGGGIGGFFKKVGKIAAVAAPIIAAPLTGGASLAAIGALSGAASGALNGGGLKGALLGAGMGAIPGIGGASSGASSAASMGTGAALKNALLNPQAITKLAGAGIGGNVGGAMQLASMVLPGASNPLDALKKDMTSLDRRLAAGRFQ